jgi:hypothetical protein
MKIFIIVLLVMTSMLACSNRPGAPAPSIKAVDSATAAAPDTIKAGSVDSMVRKDPRDTVK